MKAIKTYLIEQRMPYFKFVGKGATTLEDREFYLPFSI
jgi:hypothetical protein